MSTDLEQTAPVETPPSEPAAPALPADPDEALAVEVPGAAEKMVPLAALKAARAEIKELKPRAEQVDRIAAEWQAASPYVQFLKDNPQFMQPRADPVPTPPTADPELVELAQSLDYVKQDGSPDLVRAAKHQAIIRKEAQRMAQQMVQPVQAATYQQRAEANWAVVARETLPNGQPIDVSILSDVWKQMPLDQLANPQVARVVADQAMMMQMRKSPLRGTVPTPPNNPPIVTENVGPAPVRHKATLSELDRSVATELGKSEADMLKLVDGFVKGRPTQLED